MAHTIVQFNTVTKIFRKPFSYRTLLSGRRSAPLGTKALHKVSFALPAGTTLGLIGPNGAGKTTLLKMIATLILPDIGTVWVRRSRVGAADNVIKSCIGLMTSEERSFYWRLTGRQNLALFGALYGLGATALRGRIDTLFRSFNADYADRRFDSYSTGMKRTCALMRALLHDPALLLLDEPTKSLDHAAAQQLKKIIRDEAARGKTVIIATHHLPEAEELCDTFLIMHRGTIRAFGTMDAIRIQAGMWDASLAEIYQEVTADE